jgi:hypothetical protein
MAALIFGGNVWEFLSEIYDGGDYAVHIREAKTSMAIHIREAKPSFGTEQSIMFLRRSVLFSPAFFLLQSFAGANPGQATLRQHGDDIKFMRNPFLTNLNFRKSQFVLWFWYIWQRIDAHPGSHVRMSVNQFHTNGIAGSSSEQDWDLKITRLVLFERLSAVEQPKLGPRAGPASEQSSSVNLDNLHRKRESTEQIQLDSPVDLSFCH